MPFSSVLPKMGEEQRAWGVPSGEDADAQDRRGIVCFKSLISSQWQIQKREIMEQ